MSDSDYDFEYTEHFPVNSSVIDDIYLNENDGTAVLDVNDEFYQYTGVSPDDVEGLVRVAASNGSVGAHYNGYFKKTFGPSKHLGSFDDLWWAVVPYEDPTALATVTPITVVGPTKEYSLGYDYQAESGGSVSSVTKGVFPTKEFSLSLVTTEVARTYTVEFTNGDNVLTHTVRNADNDLDAVAQVKEFADMLNVPFEVKRSSLTLAEVTWVTALAQLDAILNEGGKVVIDFTAPGWCVPCIRFAPVFDKAAETVEDITFVAIDVDESPYFVVEYGIQSVPTVKLYEAGMFVRDIKAPQNVIPFIRDIKE